MATWEPPNNACNRRSSVRFCSSFSCLKVPARFSRGTAGREASREPGPATNSVMPVLHSTVHIKATPPDSGAAIRLMRALDEDLRARYPGVAPHGLRPEDISDDRLAFLVAHSDGEAIGCGAVRELEPGVGEVKRMFVQPAWRRRGVARQLLAALEIQARTLGYGALRLETGLGQPEAIGLYRSFWDSERRRWTGAKFLRLTSAEVLTHRGQ